MRDILFTGNIKCVTNAMLEKFDGKLKIVLCGDTSTKEFKDKRVVVYPFRENDSEYRGIFRSYNFQTVVYFSRVLDGQKRLYDELENLENTLYSATLSGVENFIYLTTNDYKEQKDTTRSKLLRTCEEICRQFVDEHNINVLILHVPYLFTKEEADCRLIRLIEQAMQEKEITLDGDCDRIVDFISDEDIGNLMARIHDEPLTGYHDIYLDGGNRMTMEALGEHLAKATGVTSIQYMGYKEAVPAYMNDQSMREYYGWFAKDLLENEIEEIVHMLCKNRKQKEKKKVRTTRNEKLQRWLLITLEMIAVFLAAEFMTSWTAENYRIDYVDFRLLFVVIMGVTHGTGAGIVASILACAGYFSRDIFESNIQIIFFNIENWLPFAAYFLSGTIVGHFRDKSVETLRFTNEQQEILEGKYKFLNELYTKTLENKEEYSRQLIGYEDSFGKIYQVVRKLNSSLTDNIFYEAVYSIEEILKTTSVAIYTIGKNSHFARLNVCSREVNARLAKSLDLVEYPNLQELLLQNQHWYNVDGIKQYPAYAAPVWKDDMLQGMIVIWNAPAKQMTMDYYNKFCILSGLVQDALIRAIEFGEHQLHNQMVDNTKILKPQYFEEILTMKEKMGKEGMSDYMLLKLRAEHMTLFDIGEAVSKSIRNTDTLGMREDGGIYLLLAQTNEKSLQIVKSRLIGKGIHLEQQ